MQQGQNQPGQMSLVEIVKSTMERLGFKIENLKFIAVTFDDPSDDFIKIYSTPPNSEAEKAVKKIFGKEPLCLYIDDNEAKYSLIDSKSVQKKINQHGGIEKYLASITPVTPKPQIGKSTLHSESKVIENFSPPINFSQINGANPSTEETILQQTLTVLKGLSESTLGEAFEAEINALVSKINAHPENPSQKTNRP